MSLSNVSKIKFQCGIASCHVPFSIRSSAAWQTSAPYDNSIRECEKLEAYAEIGSGKERQMPAILKAEPLTFQSNVYMERLIISSPHYTKQCFSLRTNFCSHEVCYSYKLSAWYVFRGW